MLHRVATSRRYNDTLADIEERWGLADVLDACRVLDALEDAEEEALERAREKR